MTVSDARPRARTLGRDSVLSCKPNMCLICRENVSKIAIVCTSPRTPRAPANLGGCTLGLFSSRCSAPWLLFLSPHLLLHRGSCQLTLEDWKSGSRAQKILFFFFSPVIPSFFFSLQNICLIEFNKHLLNTDYGPSPRPNARTSR